MSNLIVFHSPKHGQSDWDKKRQGSTLNELWRQSRNSFVSVQLGALFCGSDMDCELKVGCNGTVSGIILFCSSKTTC